MIGNQEKLIKAILENRTIGAALEAAEVSKSTYYRWLAEDQNFKDALNQAQQQLLDGAIQQLGQKVGSAADRLIDLMEQSDNEWLSRQCAKDVLDYFLRLREQQDILQRLEKLEGLIVQGKRNTF